MFATIYGLLYGNYHALHQRLVDSLIKHTPAAEAEIVLWCNTVCEATKEMLRKHAARVHYFFSDENVPKYEVMRKLFRKDHPPTAPWIVWFDDDSYIEKPDWWKKTRQFIEQRASENICYVGQRWYVHYLPGQEEFIKESKWYRGVPFGMHPTRRRGVTKVGILFATGGYVWLRTDVMEQLCWPDDRLVHNGGDTLLGEAIRQQGLALHNYSYGVAVNKAKRRGRSDRPAGSTVNVRR